MRDSSLISIRPTVITEDASGIEKFQNEALRPILKFQNELIIKLFKSFVLKSNSKFLNLNLVERKNKIEVLMKNDRDLKSTFIGIIVGHFTINELNYYFDNEKEINKRIISMLIKRVESQIESI